MTKHLTLFACCSLIFASSGVSAQDTWQRIYTIINTQCSAESGCHGDTTKPIFNADTTAEVLYDLLYNVRPVNPYADTVADYLLIDPGSLRTSFLFRKIADCPVGALELDPQEGDPMPNDQPALPDSVIELVGAWILAGAPETGVIPSDTIAGNVCLMFVSTNPLPAKEIEFTVSPNPASERFAVNYTLETSALVSIDLFDSKGMRASILHNEKRNAGAHSAPYTTKIAPGIYFVKLTVDGKEHLKKLVVH